MAFMAIASAKPFSFNLANRVERSISELERAAEPDFRQPELPLGYAFANRSEILGREPLFEKEAGCNGLRRHCGIGAKRCTQLKTGELIQPQGGRLSVTSGLPTSTAEIDDSYRQTLPYFTPDYVDWWHHLAWRVQ